MYLAMSNAVGNSELWKSDGTVAGTVLVKEIRPDGSGSNPKFFTAVGNTVFFTAYEPTNGTELWKTDGTNAGTVLVKDIYPGPAVVTGPELLTEVNGLLYFRANTVENGLELWKSDGTEAGTTVFDIYPGTSNGSPGGLTKLNTALIFGANDIAKGEELWKLETTPAATNFNWTGNVSTAWETSGNWGGNAVPTSSSAVTIPAGRPRYPVVNANTTVKSISCAAGTSVTIATGVVFNILK